RRARFRFRRAIIGDIKCPERFADGPISRNDNTFPARLDLFRATKDAVLEIEILVYEIIGKFGRGGVDEMPAQIRFPIVDWCGRESGVGRFEEFRLLHVDVAWL